MPLLMFRRIPPPCPMLSSPSHSFSFTRSTCIHIFMNSFNKRHNSFNSASSNQCYKLRLRLAWCTTAMNRGERCSGHMSDGKTDATLPLMPSSMRSGVLFLLKPKWNITSFSRHILYLWRSDAMSSTKGCAKNVLSQRNNHMRTIWSGMFPERPMSCSHSKRWYAEIDSS